MLDEPSRTTGRCCSLRHRSDANVYPIVPLGKGMLDFVEAS